MGEERGDDGGGGVEDLLAEGPLDDEDGEKDLEAEAPGDGAPADSATVGGEGVGEGEEGDEAEQAGESGQGRGLLGAPGDAGNGASVLEAL